MQEFDCLSHEVYPHPFLFLEASAGSGKTFAIEHLVIRSIIGVDRPSVLMEEMAILTFTNAATKELKERIYTALLSALHLLSTASQSTWEYINAILRKGEKEAAINLLRRAIREIQDINIFTIHGFCLKLLHSFPFESKAFIESDKTGREELETILLDELKSLSEEVVHPAQMGILLKASQKDIFKLLTKIESLMSAHLKINGGMAFNELSRAFTQATAFLKNYNFHALYTDVLAYGDLYNKMLNKNKALLPVFEEQLQLLMQGAPLEKWLKFDELFFDCVKDENKKRKEGQSHPLSYPDLIPILQKEVGPIIKEAKDQNAILFSIVNALKGNATRSIYLRPYIFPDALLSYTLACLENKDFLKKAKGQFKVAIIDEFQDTDPSQWEIFKQLFIKDRNSSHFFATVGDPKQSIYQFRGADLATYLEAKADLGEIYHRALLANYRSRRPLVEVLNALFTSENEVFSFDHSLVYHPSKFIIEDTQSLPSLTVSIYEQNASRSKAVPSLDLEEERMFPFIGQELVKLKKEGISLGDVAILVKDRHQARRVFSFLYQLGIASILARSSSIVETDAFFIMTLFLRALSCPHDDKALKNFLCHPMIHLNVEEKWQLYFFSFHELYIKRGIGAVLDAFHRTEDGLFFAKFLHSKDLSFYSDMQKLCHLLIEFECKNGKGFRKLLRYLEELKQIDEDKVYQVRRESLASNEAVHIMTIHASKGLEFKAVFALGVSSRSIHTDEIIKVKEKGYFYQAMTKEKGKNFLKEVEKREAGEKMRLLYVAMTRAKQRVYLFLILKEDASTLSLQNASPIELFFAKKFAKDKSEEALLQSLQTENRQRTKSYLSALQENFSLDIVYINEMLLTDVQNTFCIEKTTPTVLRCVNVCIKERRRLSFSSLHELEEEDRPMLQLQRNAIVKSQLPTGREVGTLLHAMIERIMDKKAPITETVSKFSLYTALEGYEKEVERLLESLFKMEVIEGLFLLDLNPKDTLYEVPFCYGNGDHEMGGFIDFVFTYKGKLYFIDWKSNFLGETSDDYEHSLLLAEMKRHGYDSQASIYKEALKKYYKICDDRNFESIFGGAIYIFLRGAPFNKGVLHFIPQ